jgi:Fe-S-cluster containining protein
MTLFETDLDTVHQHATDRRDEFEVLRYLLELNDELADAALDALVDSIAAPITAAIDCTACANCCRSLNVYLTPDDAARLATGLDIPLEAVTTRYIDRDSAAEYDEWGRFKDQPCAFLAGKLCSVYPHRPETCRTYPAFTPDFRWIMPDLIDGAARCPIIYHTLSALADRATEF